MIGTGGTATNPGNSGHGGIDLANTRIESTGNGAITLDGQAISFGGSNAVPTGNSSYGIIMRSGVTIQSNNGNIELRNGIANDPLTPGGFGILIFDSTSVNNSIRSTGSGNITLNGRSRSIGAQGVVISGTSPIISTGTGTISIEGIGQSGAVQIENAKLTTNGGNLFLSGGNNPLFITNTAITTTETGTVSITAVNTTIDNPQLIQAGTLNLSGTNLTSTTSDINLTAFQDIAIGSITNSGRAITLISQGDITTGTINTSSTTTAGGAVTLNAGRNITLGGNILSSSTSTTSNSGNGGNVTLIANNGGVVTNNTSISAVSTGANNAGNGGTVTISAGNGSIATFDQISTNSQSTGIGNAQNAGNIVLESRNGNISVDRLAAFSTATVGSSGNGGNIALTTPEGNITVRSVQSLSQGTSQAGNGGSIALAASVNSGVINFLYEPSIANTLVRAWSQAGISGIAGRGGDITVSGEEIRLPPSLDTSNFAAANPALGGNVSLTASRSITLSDNVSNIAFNTNTANVTFNTDALILRSDISFISPVTLQANTIDTRGRTIRGTDTASITLLANQEISTGDIINPGRAISLNASAGSIRTGNLNTSSTTGDGGAITLIARDSVTTGLLDSSSTAGNGGSVFIDPIGDVQVASINAQGGNAGRGGDVTVITDRFFRAMGTLTDRNNILSSISTVGGLGGGDILIRHGGGLSNTPFIIGNASLNGV